MTRTVLLWHRDIPPEAGLGGDHFDWLLEPEAGGRLVAFRVWDRVDMPDCQGFEAERLGDHRREYLEYEGPVSGGRGRVERLSQGLCVRVDEGPDLIEAVCVFEGTGELEHHFFGRREVAGRWHFVCRTHPRGGELG